MLEENNDCASIARTQYEAFKPDKFNPKCLQFIGLSARATDNLRVSYSIFPREELKEVLLQDKERLDFKCNQMRQVSVPENSCFPEEEIGGSS